MSDRALIEHLCVIGVGLIGGSLARALRAVGAVGRITGCGRNQSNLEHAVELGVIDDFRTEIASAVEGADLVLLAVPLGAMASVFGQLAGNLGPDCVVTDVGSAKNSVIEAAQAAFGELPACLVPGHPIAGTEQSGVEASFAELYRQRRVILTPTSVSDRNAVEKVRAMWEAAGAQVIEMDAGHHDEVLAATSHLPHMLAFALVDALARRPDSHEIFDYAAGGFRDFTRIASSDPVMWRDICLANQDAIVDMLVGFRVDLEELAAAIESADGAAILTIFERAKRARDEFAG